MVRTFMLLNLLCFCVFGVASCTSSDPKAAPGPLPLTPTASESLEALGEVFWGVQMSRYPTWATYLGDRRHDEKLQDLSPEAYANHDVHLSELQTQLAAIPREGLSERERITADVLAEALRSGLSEGVCKGHLWKVDQLAGPQVSLAELPNGHSVRDAREAWTLVARYRAMGPHFKQLAANLRQGLSEGLVAPKINVERVIRQIEEQLLIPVEESSYMALPLQRLADRKPSPESLAGPKGEAWQPALRAAIVESIRPGLEELKRTLKEEVLPKARAEVGVSALPLGKECYKARSRNSTGVDKSPDEIHALGLREVERIKAEMIALLRDDLGEQTLGQYLTALGKKEGQGFASREALLEYNTGLIARAQAELPRAFGKLPRTAVEMRAIEAFREKDAPAAYYYRSSGDEGQPAYYYVNAYQPETRPRYTMAVLAFHEAVPGHHLQIALAGEQSALPKFQREIGQTAYVEGWGLYAERLAGELGLYLNREEQLGALVYEMWRAVRLVVDTGMHYKGWDRARALAFLMDHTGKDVGEASNEIDRYITWPGQALAYKMGQLEILELRAKARHDLGERFDLRAFHDQLLSAGAVPMPTLRRMMEDWIQAQL